jgi:hypothetical protein
MEASHYGTTQRFFLRLLARGVQCYTVNICLSVRNVGAIDMYEGQGFAQWKGFCDCFISSLLYVNPAADASMLFVRFPDFRITI